MAATNKLISTIWLNCLQNTAGNCRVYFVYDYVYFLCISYITYSITYMLSLTRSINHDVMNETRFTFNCYLSQHSKISIQSAMQYLYIMFPIAKTNDYLNWLSIKYFKHDFKIIRWILQFNTTYALYVKITIVFVWQLLWRVYPAFSN